MKLNKSIQFGLGMVAVAGLIGGTGLLSLRADEKMKAQPEPKCKISPVDAIKIAHTKVKGTVIQSNFEFDEGKWVYGVMIVEGKTIKEVEIDPISGKIGDVETVTPEDEAKEMKDALTKAIGGATDAAKPSGEKAKDEEDEKDEKPKVTKKP